MKQEMDAIDKHDQVLKSLMDYAKTSKMPLTQEQKDKAVEQRNRVCALEKRMAQLKK